MKAQSRQLLIVFVVIAFTATLTSCNFPVKSTPAAQTTVPPPVGTTPPPPVAATPEPATAEPVQALLPVTGSILRWIDLSDFVYVPGGDFTMGQDSSTPSDHAPAHKVTLNGFWIQQAEVTNQQYAQCVSAGKCTAPSKEPKVDYWFGLPAKGSAPVVGVTWNQAQDYCTYIDSRLPTEAEWEATARGTEGKIFPWGSDKPTCDLLNYNDCLDPSVPVDVRSYNNGASDYLAMDMAGNVNEWVSDWYAEDYYATSPAANPIGPADGTKKVFRGGSYRSSMDDVNSFVRFSAKPVEHGADLGFRCVLTGDYAKQEVPRQCSVVPFDQTQPKEQPTWTPIPCESAQVSGLCVFMSGKAYTQINVKQENCAPNEIDSWYSSDIQNLDCHLGVDAPDYKSYICGGSNLVQGGQFILAFNHVKDFVLPFTPSCPAGFEYNSTTHFCEPNGTWLPDPPCPSSYTEWNGVCLPDGGIGGCPVGFYSYAYSDAQGNHSGCMPLDECLLPGSTVSCAKPVCAAGQTYDPAKQCCSVPTQLQEFCPAGFYYYFDTSKNTAMCLKVLDGAMKVEARTVKIPYCPTPTVTPTATQNCHTVISPTGGKTTVCD
jgi:hypothetical protein